MVSLSASAFASNMCSTPVQPDGPSSLVVVSAGAVAQLVEHHDGIVGVARSSRVSSTHGAEPRHWPRLDAVPNLDTMPNLDKGHLVLDYRRMRLPVRTGNQFGIGSGQ